MRNKIAAYFRKINWVELILVIAALVVSLVVVYPALTPLSHGILFIIRAFCLTTLISAIQAIYNYFKNL
ncbi:MAG: hypothetical protein HFJ94_06295 [Muribaculaceae bacterium]|nr:hypothetical protein [Muribaculaceae bacterium]